MQRLYWNSSPILPVTSSVPASQQYEKKAVERKAVFQDLLQEAQQKLNFSGHAQRRLQERGIQLSEQELAKLDDTVEKLAQKGARESLVYMGDVALVVSVTNRTVITAMDGKNTRDNIITNIDSAAIL